MDERSADLVKAGSFEQDKRVVEELFEVIHGRANLSRLDGIVAEDYVQHNPYIAQGREGLREFFAHVLSLPEEERLDLSKTIEVRLVSEGGFVLRHEVREDGVLFDLFRVREGLLVEHWDAFRPAPGAAPIFGL